MYPISALKQTGTSVYAEGQLVMPPKTNAQRIELKVLKIIKVGTVDRGYPLPKRQRPLLSFLGACLIFVTELILCLL